MVARLADPQAQRLRFFAQLGQYFRWLTPSALAAQIPHQVYQQLQVDQPSEPAKTNIVLLQGCAQQVSTGATNEHLAALLAEKGIA